jgi:RNA polymerase sigma-70 factor (ECF subfamily)
MPVRQERSALPSDSPTFLGATAATGASFPSIVPPIVEPLCPPHPVSTRDKINGSGVLSSCVLNSPEDSIIQSALSGDERAFEYLFHQYRGQVFHVCLRYSNGDRDQAHDLCQEAFISAFSKLERLRDRSRFFYWIAEIAKNKCLSFIRKQRAAVKLLREYEVIKPAMSAHDSQWTEAELELITELIHGMENADLRETIRLFYIEGKKTSDISRLQKISQTAVTTRLNRFRAKFRKRITQEILKRRTPE